MAEVRTNPATVTRIVGSRGVAIEEVTGEKDGKEFKNRFTVWVGEGHGLNEGDKARFYGEIGMKSREHNDKTYWDMVISKAQVLEGTLVRAPRPAPEDANASSWETATPGEPWQPAPSDETPF